jgi:hypothetical protein
MVQQQQQVNQEQDKSRTIEEKFNKLKDVYQKLREEHIGLLRYETFYHLLLGFNSYTFFYYKIRDR